MTAQLPLRASVFVLIACVVGFVPAAAETSEESRRSDELSPLIQRLEQAAPPRVRPGSAIPYQPPGQEKQELGIVPDRLVLKLKSEFARQATALPEDGLPRGLEPLDRFLEAHGIRNGHRVARARGKPFTGRMLDAYLEHGMDRLYVLVLPRPDEKTVLDLVAELSAEPWVEYATPATFGVPVAAPNDTFYPQQWEHNNTGQSGGTADADMDTQEAWDITTGSSGVIVAVADTGTLLSHPDLAGNLVPNCGNAAGTCYDFGDDDFDPNPHSVFGSTHGTNTGGILAAVGNNGIGVAGTCYGCSLMALKTCADFGGCTSTAFQDAIVHAANNGASVLSISFCFGWDQAWVDAVNTARSMGMVITASLGNATSRQACVPATVPGVMAIGGTDDDDLRIFALGSHHFVSAPGTGIYTTSYTGGLTPSYTSTFGGTSASAPFVGAIAGLLRSQDASLHVNELEALIALGADDQVGPPSEDTPGFDVFFGHGRANARNSADLVNSEWINIDAPQHVCGRTITVGYHNPSGCDGQNVTVSGDIGGDSVTAVLSQVTSGGYCEATIDLNWALVGPIDLGDSFLTIEHGETITAQKNGVTDVSVADCEREVCHWSTLTNWDIRDLTRGDCDADGAFDTGHLLRIAPAFVNVETEVMTGAVMTLSTDSPYLDITVDALALSDLSPFSGFTLDPDVDPIFTIRVLPGAPPNSVATIDIDFFSLDGWVTDPTGCTDFGFSNQITVPLNRDTGTPVQEFDFDDGTAQGWTSASPHGTTTMDECDDFAWDQNEWGSAPTTDNPHQGTHAMRLGDGTSYSTGIDAALESPVISWPVGGLLGFYIYADTETAGAGFAYDGVALEGKAVGEALWSPMPVSKLGSFSSEPVLDGCFQVQAGISFPFGTADRVPLIAGNAATDTPFGDAYDYEHYVELDGLSGQNGQVRFRAGSDSDSVEGTGVWVDTIRVYSGWIGDSWTGIGPGDISGSDAGCPASFDITAATVPGAAGYNLYRSEDSCLDAFTRTDVFDTSATPSFTDSTVVQDVGYFYAVEGFEAGTSCPTTRVCLAGGCCTSLPADPTGFRVDPAGADELTSWDDPGISGMTWFMYYDNDRDPSTWGPAQYVDLTDEDPGQPGIQHTADLPDPAVGEVVYVQVTAVDCGESPLF